jgi:hypothetical protein
MKKIIFNKEEVHYLILITSVMLNFLFFGKQNSHYSLKYIPS